MKNPKITFIVNGNTYSLRATDIESIDGIAKLDRLNLVELLEAIRRQAQLSKVVVQAAVDDLTSGHQTTRSIAGQGDEIAVSAGGNTEADRLSTSQVDDLMARLIMEEKQQTKPGLTRSGIYKFVGCLAIVVIIFILAL